MMEKLQKMMAQMSGQQAPDQSTGGTTLQDRLLCSSNTYPKIKDLMKAYHDQFKVQVIDVQLLETTETYFRELPKL